MWSGPRNISTALMRSWGSRSDTFVCDEPFYAHYLKVTGVEHPGRAEVMASQESDWHKVVEWLTGPIPDRKQIFYQKHMAHHLLPNMDRAWLGLVSNVFLIRDPREMLTSLIKVTPEARLDDTGLPQQWEIFEWVRQETGLTPPVLDTKDVLEDPRGVLGRLCGALGVGFSESMLSWKPGRRPTDGVWAPHWYGAVEKSTGFQPYVPKKDRVPVSLQGVLDQCNAYYGKLYQNRLVAGESR